MSVNILDKDTIIKQKSDGFRPLIIGDPATIFHARAARLRQLAPDSFMADYLLLAGQIVQQQLHLVDTFNGAVQQQLAAQTLTWPLEIDGSWQAILDPMLTQLTSALRPVVSDDIVNVIDNISQIDQQTLQHYFHALQQNQAERVPADIAIILWSCINTLMSLIVTNTQLEWQPEANAKQSHCPLCGGAPAASLIQGSGHRYLHCSQCEAQWHRLRAECTQCGDGENIQLQSETLEDSVRAETCRHCQSYLKMLVLEKNPQLDPIADDLATIVLDQKLGEMEFYRSGFNPFLLPLAQ
ncbi:formate dehydrogenase accessory protein FdhE [Photobacterium aquimaris]|uniref:Formate dehydrogenase accessory protein FdhE n=1 Tax=Photobacterium aquimaris TaxID=512643 RepID=A0A2T3IJH7_9GAMM|nr:formate dehydrogenase accessory protein FdhE [Photobacterium aquimaris]OBU16491.1 formate dehydrogenase accessory protein FdhE [Photobacterium aquimaris]OBU17379.1 formate dehydrogenase accessory protein FdhE [Photobacterium aquimaris]PSU28497.1 formate dehydrogenase accessory protein FdhE [Photobacterium aquimaris]PSW02693.1 formate dehydrogenase accessory protein FdhE [Photobacterium aquimaris]